MASRSPAARAPLRTERLVALVEVARHEGFSRAARALGRTQSSLSQSVAALEADVGAPLLVREGRRTRPTEAGRLLVAAAERVLGDLERARAELDALGALTRGRLVVGTTDTLAMHVLPPVLRELRTRHPGVELVLDHRPSPIIAERVADGAVDLGVVTLPLPAGLRVRGRAAEGELRVEPLGKFEDALVCPAGHRLAERPRVTAADLAGEPMLLLDRSTAGRAYLDAWLAERGVSPRVAMEMASVDVLIRLVELGFGVTVVPSVAVRGREGALVTRPLAALRPRRVGLVTPSVGPLSPAARAFVALARSLADAPAPA
jgi:DNA-binding transcriptional LysR family regulator